MGEYQHGSLGQLELIISLLSWLSVGACRLGQHVSPLGNLSPLVHSDLALHWLSGVVHEGLVDHEL